MILTCPACSTRFLVDPSKIGPEGRTVRCGKCKETWHQTPPVEEPDTVEAVPIPPEPKPIPKGSGLPAQPRRRRRRKSRAGWLLFLLLLVLAGVGAVVARDQVIRAWPPAAEWYEMAGLTEKEAEFGLELRNVASSRKAEDGVQILEIRGQVVNVTSEPVDVPKLRAVLRDSDNREIQRWTFSAEKARLEGGETTTFETSLRNPPAEATGLSITFEGVDQTAAKE